MSDEPTYEELVGPEAIQDEDLEAGVRLAAHDLFLRLQGTFSAPAYITLEEGSTARGQPMQWLSVSTAQGERRSGASK
jgi:hypothetical protein